MASPGLESFCCMQNLSHHYVDTHSKYFNFQSNTYNGICIVTSSFSILGALFLMTPWSKIRASLAGAEGIQILPHNNSVRNSYQKQIIFWLSVADLMACLGILVRAAVWFADKYPLARVPETTTADFAHVFCAVSTAWIQFFYTCTYMWTFLYAVDVACRVSYRQSNVKLYHFVGWIVPMILTVGGLIPLYSPNILECYYSIPKVLPGYLSAVVPMFFVMVVNPPIYLYASTAVKNVVSGNKGRYTDAERMLVLRIREKYFLIMLVFYVCWLPNVINCLLIMCRHFTDVTFDVWIAVWNAMAVSNPLQAFLNVLAYKTFSQATFGRARLTANYICRAVVRKVRPRDRHNGSGDRSALIQSQENL